MSDWEGASARGEESISQAVGRAVFEAGFEGLIAPSGVNWSGRNVVVFLENLGPRSDMEAVDEDGDDKNRAFLLDLMRRKGDTSG